MSYYQKNALVQFRVDENVKREAEKYIKICGFDMPTAIRTFLHMVIYAKGMPFPVTSKMPTAFKGEEEERELVENEAEEGYNKGGGQNYDSI